MKIGGIDPTTLPSEVFLVLPRGDQEIVFRAQPVKDMDAFEALCPRPTPPGKMTREGWVPLDNDPTYQTVLAAWANQRLGYHSQGGHVTNIGDINVSVTGGPSGRQTARSIATELRRELRRGTSVLS